eukprot:97849-Amorphochlora_amoeboformis.AAC.1
MNLRSPGYSATYTQANISKLRAGYSPVKWKSFEQANKPSTSHLLESNYLKLGGVAEPGAAAGADA